MPLLRFLFAFAVTALVLVPFFLPAMSQAKLTITPVNGLSTDEDIKVTIVKIIKWILLIVGSVGILALIYGGVLYIISAGNEKTVEQAKNILKWTIVGLTIILLAYTIISTLNCFFFPQEQGCPGVPNGQDVFTLNPLSKILKLFS